MKVAFTFFTILMASFALAQHQSNSAQKSQSLLLNTVAYQPTSVISKPMKTNTSRLRFWNPLKVNAQVFSVQSSVSPMQIDNYQDQLSQTYENMLINFTSVDQYAVKYKYTNRALYEAGKNTIFSQIENPFACNMQF
ncbi:hypothetical protein [Nonlabens ponticola]|uniref:Uncharacterized protein n=1 Tax=Nonlabens ponticola TaxID=2496866 RepID=A0A3S9MX84_9FLAO|nr:hypothetical protein [Nonlabens ponticola]AZQ43749.1 hypothetical protein EJ995_05715 [Nonlabens ponticola]